MQVKSYSGAGGLKELIQALAGVSSFTTEEDSKILSFVNRRAAEAYNLSPSWARYLVVSEERTITTANTIPYTQATKDDIGEFIRIHRKQAFLNDSSLEYDFYVDSNGANILNIVNTEDTSAFVTYKKELAAFTETSEDIPLEFFYFVAHAAYADFLRMDGQHGKALTEEQIAKNYLDIELEKIDIRNNNNSINHKFSTYVNRQSR
jgi:predicted small secreted protein